MARQLRQGYPKVLRASQQSPDSALLSLISAIAHKHPQLDDENEDQYQRRLRNIAVRLVSQAGAVLVRSDNTEELQA